MKTTLKLTVLLMIGAGLAACESEAPGVDLSTELTGAEWVIEDIAAGGVIDNSQPSLLFQEDGSLAGSTGCNRILGQYALDGQTLTIEPAGTTMMACPPALMNQERKLLDLLPMITTAQIDETGALRLGGAEGIAITARRQ
ncbi:META domain-containing protein [Sulfitobacter aestuarii]|uniref:META domain-containing protein n=1 Tax=Sulfitobacter aestuarii TaxID=2161676 RepID=A0ABW5TZH7_9RHOB